MSKRNKGIIMIILSAFSFSFMFAFVRLAGDLPTMQKVFFRNFVALFFAAGVMIKNKVPFRCQNRKNSAVLFVRALAGCSTVFGASRLLEEYKSVCSGKKLAAEYAADPIHKAVTESYESSFAVLVSGDPGFYSASDDMVYVTVAYYVGGVTVVRYK